MTEKSTLIRVKDVMKTDFGTIDGVATVADALKRMKTLKTAVLIVNKRNEDDEYGISLMIKYSDGYHRALHNPTYWRTK